MIRTLCIAAALVVIAGACGDDAGPEATPEQAEAIGTLIDADLTDDEQRCILEELIATGIEPLAIVDGTVTGDEDAELLAIAVTCVEDLASVPAFVQSVIDASAEAGTAITEAQAICVIDRMADDDPVSAAADCIEGAGGTDGGDTSGDPIDTYGDDPTLDLLWDACERGNNQACDELYTSAPLDSAYLDYARTCAGRLPDSVGLRCFLDLG
ncbi:MAG: hypothetical protein R2707_17660 [Acidimicrobiales bacterium]